MNGYLPDAFLNRVRFVTISTQNSAQKELIIPLVGSEGDMVQRHLVVRIAKDRVLSFKVNIQSERDGMARD